MKDIKTRKYTFFLYPCLLLGFTFIGILIFSFFPKKLQDLDIKEKIPTENLSEEKIVPVEKTILDSMSIEEKVGQLFIFGFEGTTVNDENRDILENCKVGGVLLLKRNITGVEQLKKLIQQLQELNNVPMFTAIDQEGGPVARIRWDSILTIAQSEIKTTEQAYSVAKDRGDMLKDYGINMNLAPVIEYITDTDSFIYNRVYRGNQTEVSNKAISAIKGYTDAGIISVPKHFPGHSDTSPDSHYALPVVKIRDNQWDEYIKPFSTVLENVSVDALMVGHIQYPNIDRYPSSVSKEIITNRLIQDLKYEGIVISDDMEMAALDDIGTEEEIAKQALIAGNDILIYSRYNNNNPSLREEIYNYIVKEVRDGNLDIDEKVLRVLKTKIKYNILSF